MYVAFHFTEQIVEQSFDNVITTVTKGTLYIQRQQNFD